MQQLLLRAVLPLVFASSALHAQGGDRMGSKGDSSPGAMGAAGMQHQMDRSVKRDMDARRRMSGREIDRMRQQMGGVLVGVGGHRTTGMVRVSSNGLIRTIALDSNFAIVGGSGSGLYLSDRERFDISATRVGALSKEMGAQSYQVRLAAGVAPRHLLIVNESSHAVLARASLGGAMQK